MSTTRETSVRAREPSIGLSRHALAAIFLRCVLVSLEFLGGIVLARIFLASGYGVYATVIACVGMLVIPATLGLDRVVLREVAVCRARGEWSQLRGLVTRSFQLVLGGSLTVAALAGLVLYLFRASIAPAMTKAMLLGLSILPLVSLARLRAAVLQGHGKVLTGALPESIVLPGSVLVLAVVVGLLPGSWRTPESAVAVNVAASLLALGVGTWLLHQFTPDQYRTAKPQFDTEQWILAALPMAWVVGMNLVIANADVVMLAALDSSASAGIYRVAAQMAAFVALPLGAVNAVLAPRIAAAYSIGDRGELQRLTTRSLKIVVSLALPAAVALLVFGDFLLSLYGAEFVSARPALNLLVVGQLVNAATGSVGYLLIMTRHEKLAAAIFGAMAIFNVLLNFVLIPSYGLLGAATAACTTLAVLNLLLAWSVTRRLGIRTVALLRVRR